MRTRISAAIASVAFCALSVGAAQARTLPGSPLEPPGAQLVAGEASQEGNIKSGCWSQGVVYGVCHDQDFYVFPKQAVSSRTASIVFGKAEPPDKVTLKYWTRIRRDDVGEVWFDRPRGEARVLEAELDPVIDSDGIRWAATFEVDRSGPFYIAATARWDNTDAACPGCRQWATWSFFLRAPR